MQQSYEKYSMDKLKCHPMLYGCNQLTEKLLTSFKLFGMTAWLLSSISFKTYQSLLSYWALQHIINVSDWQHSDGKLHLGYSNLLCIHMFILFVYSFLRFYVYDFLALCSAKVEMLASFNDVANKHTSNNVSILLIMWSRWKWVNM